MGTHVAVEGKLLLQISPLRKEFYSLFFHAKSKRKRNLVEYKISKCKQLEFPQKQRHYLAI